MSNFEREKKRLEKFSSYAKALAHPIRIQILEKLKGSSCIRSGHLSGEFHISRSTFSQHLSELKKVGLIQGEIDLPRIKYCINKDKWEEVLALFSSLFESY